MPLINIYPFWKKKTLTREPPCLEDVLNTLWNEKNQKFYIVKSHWNFTGMNLENKSVNVVSLRWWMWCLYMAAINENKMSNSCCYKQLIPNWHDICSF